MENNNSTWSGTTKSVQNTGANRSTGNRRQGNNGYNKFNSQDRNRGTGEKSYSTDDRNRRDERPAQAGTQSAPRQENYRRPMSGQVRRPFNATQNSQAGANTTSTETTANSSQSNRNYDRNRPQTGQRPARPFRSNRPSRDSYRGQNPSRARNEQSTDPNRSTNRAPSDRSRNSRSSNSRSKGTRPRQFGPGNAESIIGASKATHTEIFSHHLKVCTLSGTTEIGRNCNFVEFGNDIVVIDFGLSFPGQELLGVDYTIPNFEYLKKNKDRIRAILITHGHLDHTGGLPYVVEQLGFPPIYAGRYAKALMEERMKEAELDTKVKIEAINRNTVVTFGQITATFIGVTHSIPNSFGIMISTKDANVFFTGDYKLDPTPANEHPTDIAALKSWQGKIDLALMESTNPEREGHALSDKIVAENLHKFVKNHKGRIVVAAFASLVSRLYSLVQIAQMTNRKLFISGRSLNTAVKISREQRFIEFPEDLVVEESKLASYPDDKILFVCTGSQGERYAALNRIANGEHKYFKLKSGDLVLMSSSEVPGNEHTIEKMTDKIVEKGADLVQSSIADIHGSGHGLIADMEQMYNLLQPKCVMPIHGSLTKRYKNKLNIVKWGMPDEKVLLTTDGAVWTYYPSTKEWKRTSTIESRPVLIDGLGVGDISDIVLQDRQQLSQFGMVVITLNLSSKSKQMIASPKLVSRGFVYVKNSQELFNDIDRIVRETHQQWHQESTQSRRFESDMLLDDIRRNVEKYIYKKTEREPMVLPVIV